MKAKLRDYLDLVRLPNLFTAAADSVAGFLYVGGSPADVGLWLRLGIASMFLYAGGVALNDVCDAAIDAMERASRPIPSEKIPRVNALGVSIACLIAGIALAVTISPQCAAVALGIALCIVLYDTVLKKTPVAPALMGACRGLNLLLGMTSISSLAASTWVEPVVLLFIYVTSLTFFARSEARESSRVRLAAGSLGLVFATAALLSLSRHTSAIAALVSGIAIVTLVTWLGLNAANAVASPTPMHVQRAVRRLVMGIVLFDACLVLTAGTSLPAMCIAALYIPAVVTARRLRVT